MNNKELYESIIKDVSKIIKKHLDEKIDVRDLTKIEADRLSKQVVSKISDRDLDKLLETNTLRKTILGSKFLFNIKKSGKLISLELEMDDLPKQKGNWYELKSWNYFTSDKNEFRELIKGCVNNTLRPGWLDSPEWYD